MTIAWNIHDDGSFDIDAGDVRLHNCYPGMDGQSLRPIRVDVNRTNGAYEVVYTLPRVDTSGMGSDRCVVIRLAQDAEGVEGEGASLLVAAELHGFETAPQWFDPLFRVQVESLGSVYRQGFGIGAATGILRLERLAEQPLGRAESYGLAVLNGQDGSNYLGCWSDMHDNYVHRYELQSAGGEAAVGAFMTAGFRMERIRLKAEKIALPPLKLRRFAELEEALSAAASAIGNAMHARTKLKPAYHWCSWYYWYHRFSHRLLREYLPAFQALQPPLPLQGIQIDAGYFPSAGDWLETNELWPDGLEPAFADITESGYAPGIWIAPFMVGNRSRLYQEHPEWVLHDLTGRPVVEWKCYNEPKAWGYADDEYYVLDTSHPDAMSYIRGVFRTFRRQGVKLYKTDFMLWGIQDSAKVVRHVPGRTSVQYFRELLAAIREEIGEESRWIGCIAPFMPFVGYADAMRIGDDVGAEWNGKMFGPENMIRQISGCNYMNGLLWQNDPDAVLLRDFHIHMSGAELEALALLQAVSGGAIYTSDPLHELPLERLNLFRWMAPGDHVVRARQPLLHEDRQELVFVRMSEEGDTALLLFFNPGQEKLTEQYELRRLIGGDKWHLSLWNGECEESRLNGLHEHLIVKLSPHGSRLYFASMTNWPEESHAPEGLTL